MLALKLMAKLTKHYAKLTLNGTLNYNNNNGRNSKTTLKWATIRLNRNKRAENGNRWK